jgi:hypothetical protein
MSNFEVEYGNTKYPMSNIKCIKHRLSVFYFDIQNSTFNILLLNIEVKTKIR